MKKIALSLVIVTLLVACCTPALAMVCKSSSTNSSNIIKSHPLYIQKKINEKFSVVERSKLVSVVYMANTKELKGKTSETCPIPLNNYFFKGFRKCLAIITMANSKGVVREVAYPCKLIAGPNGTVGAFITLNGKEIIEYAGTNASFAISIISIQ